MEVRATSIDPRTGMGAVTLAVSDLFGMTHFYRSAIGLAVLETSPGLHTLGAGGRPLVRLLHRSNARSVPHTTGLFHLALLLPDRAWLGAWIRHFVEAGYTLDGAGDHSVSEAFYLTDPEGNGIEVYRDRPRSEWEFLDGQLRMGTERVDLKAVYAAGAGVAWSGAPPETKMGHVHFRVAALPPTAVFYEDVLGMDTMATLPGAGFFSAGGYHHHIGANTWYSAGAASQPADALGLVSAAIVLPDIEERYRRLARIDAAGYAVEDTAEGPAVRDPSGNLLVFVLPPG